MKLDDEATRAGVQMSPHICGSQRNACRVVAKMRAEGMGTGQIGHNRGMDLGAFSISLNVADLAASEAFYEKLGFERTGGDGEGYVIMVNGKSVIGLFHAMFEGNILTFNPGLTVEGPLQEFQDIRDIRAALVESGIELIEDLDPAETGPAHITLTDPDGNAILIDQFFPRPG